MTSIILATPFSTGTNDAEVVKEQQINAVTRQEAGWANVNRIAFGGEYASFNSGVTKLVVGQPVRVEATVNYSGDMGPIQQSMVTFENVNPGLEIGYDGTIEFIGKQAKFSFMVTLLESGSQTRLFSVKVSDGVLGDNQHLTSYSQTQTIVENPNGKKDPRINPIIEPEPKEERIVDPIEEAKPDIDEEPTPDPKEEPVTEPEEELTPDSKEEQVVTPEEPITESKEEPNKEPVIDPDKTLVIQPIEKRIVVLNKEPVMEPKNELPIARVNEEVSASKEVAAVDTENIKVATLPNTGENALLSENLKILGMSMVTAVVGIYLFSRKRVFKK